MKKIVILNMLLILYVFSFGQKEEYISFDCSCEDGVDRPFVIYTPKNIDKKSEKPLLVYLHGAVSNPSLKKDPIAYMKRSPLIQLAEKGDFYLMFCYGQKGATWFDQVGTNMIVKEIEMAKQHFNINENKIFLSGFSDGGSGVFYISMTNPMPFAGFIAMNGNLKVAQKLGELDIFPENTNQKPLYVINTQKDMLYPIHQVTPTIDYLKQYNNHITYKTPEGNHEMSYLEKETDDIISFIHQNTNITSNLFSWETSSLDNNTIQGISIIEIDSLAMPKKWHEPYDLKVLNDKAYFGLRYDYSYQGKGLKVKGFKNDTCTAKRMGVEINDIILMMGQDSLTSPYSSFYYKSKKKAGDETSLTLLREGNEKTLTGTFNPGYYYRIFNNKAKSAKIKATIENGNLIISTSKVKQLSIDMNVLSTYQIKNIIINKKDYNANFKGVKTFVIEG